MKPSVTGVRTDAFTFELQCTEELKALRWHNHLTDTVLDLGQGNEIDLEVDAANERIWIEGWHCLRGSKEACAPDDEVGFKEGRHLPDYPDLVEPDPGGTVWKRDTNLIGLFDDITHWGWARTRFFLPENFIGEPLTFTLGGLGLGDFRHTRVFLNGALIGERQPKGRWFEPGVYHLRPEDKNYSQLRFGQINILALQLGKSINRNLRLDEVDPAHAFHWPYPHLLQPAYFQHIEIGEHPVRHPRFTIESVCEPASGNGLSITLVAEEVPLQAVLNYQPSDDGRVLRKSVTLCNHGGQPIRIMSVGLGNYQTRVAVTEGDIGFPVHVANRHFLSLDHPAGYAMGAEGRVQLRQFPGALLHPQQSFSCMNAIFGVSEAGGSRKAFIDYLQPRTRRARRGHEKPLAIASMFGGWSMSEGKLLEDELSESVCLHFASWFQEFKHKSGAVFDLISVDFWQDPTADLLRFNRHFPNGFQASRKALTATGAKHGLWIDSSMFAKWHVGFNPLLSNCLAGQPSYAVHNTDNWGYSPMCRSSEPIRSLFQSAFVKHVVEGGARLLKFDNLVSTCHNQNHGHWPGAYSTEAIYNSVIKFFTALDEACPEVFLMLYWGYRSPWWLLHGDTQFESGIKMEASTPSATPSLYVRDGVTLTLDQGTAFASDLPKLGKDSLGVWLSRWPWNSSIGKERWREGVIMDMGRGNLILQPWLGEDPLDEDEMRDLASFLMLLRSRGDCFANSQLIGDPLKSKPYGYSCSDGNRCFVAFNNFSWSDHCLQFGKPESFGLSPKGLFEVFRHYPSPARLLTTTDWLRPFQVSLYEIVPAGETATGATPFPPGPKSASFEESSVKLAINIERTAAGWVEDQMTVAFAGMYDEIKESREPWRGHVVSAQTPASQIGGQLVLCATASCEGKAVPTGSMGAFFKAIGHIEGIDIPIQPVLADKAYPSTWQGWRLNISQSRNERFFEIKIVSRLPVSVELAFDAYFIPATC